MENNLQVPDDVEAKIHQVLTDLYAKADVDCVLLADISGQLIDTAGHTNGMDTSVVSVLAAGQLAAMEELSRQIGDPEQSTAFLQEGQNRRIYLFNVAGSFVLIVIFGVSVPLGVVRLFATQAVEILVYLSELYEMWASQSSQALGMDFGNDDVLDFGAELDAELDIQFGADMDTDLDEELSDAVNITFKGF